MGRRDQIKKIDREEKAYKRRELTSLWIEDDETTANNDDPQPNSDDPQSIEKELIDHEDDDPPPRQRRSTATRSTTRSIWDLREIDLGSRIGDLEYINIGSGWMLTGRVELHLSLLDNRVTMSAMCLDLV